MFKKIFINGDFRAKKYFLPVVLCVIFTLLTFITWGKWGNEISDCFRECIIPKALLEGKVLYSDITCLYPPLGYQLNALWFAIFGKSVNVLYFVGIVNTLTILSIVYWGIKKSSSGLTAFVTVLSIMLIFSFRVVQSNFASWIFPYSYSFLYAFCSCIFSVAIYICYVNTKKIFLLYIASFLIGLSFTFKADFVLFVILPFLSAILTKSPKKFIICSLSFFIPLAVSFLVWFTGGGSWDILKNYKDFLVDFAHAPSVLKYNSIMLVQKIDTNVLRQVWNSFFLFCVVFAEFSLIILFFELLNEKIKTIVSKLFWTAVMFVTLFFFIKYFAVQQIAQYGLHKNFLFIPYFVIVSALTVFFLKLKEKNYTKIEKLYFLLAISGFLISYRTFAAVFNSYIGNFIIIIYWIAFVLFFMEILPEYIQVFDCKKYKTFVCSVIIAFSLSFGYIYIVNSHGKSYQISGSQNKGSFYTTKNNAKILNDIISYVENNTQPDETVLVAEEGLSINYFSGRNTNLKYYALIPHIIDTYGEENILTDLQQNMPDYVILTNHVYPFEGRFGIDYAKKITDFIFSNYEVMQPFSDGHGGFEAVMLKHRV